MCRLLIWGVTVDPQDSGQASQPLGSGLADGLVTFNDHHGAAAPPAPVELKGGHVQALGSQRPSDLTDTAGLVRVVNHKGRQFTGEGGIQTIHPEYPDTPPAGRGTPYLQLSSLVPLQRNEHAVGVNIPQVTGAKVKLQPPLLRQGKAVGNPAVVGGEAQQSGNERLMGAMALPRGSERPVKQQFRLNRFLSQQGPGHPADTHRPRRVGTGRPHHYRA